MTEKWLPVPGYEGNYEASDMGRIRSLDRVVVGRNGSRRWRGIMLKQPIARRGINLRPTVMLYRDGVGTNMLVHNVIMMTFVGPRPAGLMCCHYNDDPTDNRLSNLRWDTHSANMLDAVRNGRHPKSKRTHCVNGHEFSAENSYFHPSRNRKYCKVCKNQKLRDRRVAERIENEGAA